MVKCRDEENIDISSVCSYDVMIQIDGVPDDDIVGYQVNGLLAIEAPPRSDASQQHDDISVVSQYSIYSVHAELDLNEGESTHQ